MYLYLLDDLLYLKQGDNMVVDATVIKSEMCEVDESIITGESDSIKKKPGDKLISGSIITSGNVYAKVSSINRDTYANNISSGSISFKIPSLITFTLLFVPIDNLSIIFLAFIS